MWIVPGQVQVREDGDSLYVLNAQLAVKAVPDHIAGGVAGCHYDAQTDARGQRLDNTMIVPLITKMVNTAPEYAPIRRAFMARIVAQWIRDRYDSGQHTSFDSLIDSGNLGPARLTDGWQPRQVFNAYVNSLHSGAFTYNTTIHQGSTTIYQKITIGGVDFTSLNPTAVSAAQMNSEYPQLAAAAKSSLSQPASVGGETWLGDTITEPNGGSSGDGVGGSQSSGSSGGPIGSLFDSPVSLILIMAAISGISYSIRRRRHGRRSPRR
jgi:hypothetical protein